MPTARILLLGLFVVFGDPAGSKGAGREKALVAPSRSVSPRIPKVGEPVDDAGLDEYFEQATRRLLAEGKVAPLSFNQLQRPLTLPAVSETVQGWTPIAGQAELATLVLGEVFREGKSRKDQFTVAAGGFLVADSGVVVTCLHVAQSKGHRGMTALLRDGRVFAVQKVLAFDPINDLVVLQLDLPTGTLLPALPLAMEPAPLATPVGVMSHPEAHYWLWTSGQVARQTVFRETSGEVHFTTITADFAKGSSGCPVLDERGNVVAVVNNTESIYYEDDGKKKQSDLQMVIKNATPSWLVRKLIAAPALGLAQPPQNTPASIPAVP